MPAKSTKKTQNENGAPDFVLKHRIAGAAFLLFFGALVLPWLLGDPSAASKIEQVEGVSSTVHSDSQDPSEAQTLEDELLAAIESKKASEPEQVYISKITPLEGNSTVETLSQPAVEAAKSTSGSPQPKAKPAGQAVAVSADKTEKKAAAQAIPAAGSSSTTASLDESKAAKTLPATKDPVPPAATVKSSIEVGWVVQVGVFTDKNGAARVVDDLRTKGFDPQTTIVDTNRGKATGTRIWLGPFVQRVDAAKAKTRLTKQTGEAGFIRAYP